jgi:dsRNA-specific ribonuclease
MLSGDTNEMWKKTASKNTLAGKCRSSGLAGCILRAPGDQVLPASTKATAAEAVIGAVFLDGGYEAASRVMATLGLV